MSYFRQMKWVSRNLNAAVCELESALHHYIEAEKAVDAPKNEKWSSEFLLELKESHETLKTKLESIKGYLMK